jgi:hypothetical protein
LEPRSRPLRDDTRIRPKHDQFFEKFHLYTDSSPSTEHALLSMFFQTLLYSLFSLQDICRRSGTYSAPGKHFLPARWSCTTYSYSTLCVIVIVGALSLGREKIRRAQQHHIIRTLCKVNREREREVRQSHNNK